MKQTHFIFPAIIILVFLGGYFLYTNSILTPIDRKTENSISPKYANATTDMIVVVSPEVGDTEEQEFIVLGKARGTWYFEASFPIVVLDTVGRVIAESHAEAKDDWMTEEFVMFAGVVKLKNPYTGSATLVLKNDNPSGEPGRDRSVSIPITIE